MRGKVFLFIAVPFFGFVAPLGGQKLPGDQVTKLTPDPDSRSALQVRGALLPSTPQPSPPGSRHRFWDRRNRWLFAGAAAARALDYTSTLNMRHRHRDEILLSNDVVDNHAAFAAIEAAGTLASIGASYLFHGSGHHKLERWTSYIHIGVGMGGAIRNYNLKTRHVRPAGP